MDRHTRRTQHSWRAVVYEFTFRICYWTSTICVRRICARYHPPTRWSHGFLTGCPLNQPGRVNRHYIPSWLQLTRMRVYTHKRTTILTLSSPTTPLSAWTSLVKSCLGCLGKAHRQTRRQSQPCPLRPPQPAGDEPPSWLRNHFSTHRNGCACEIHALIWSTGGQHLHPLDTSPSRAPLRPSTHLGTTFPRRPSL